jgi:putative SOS response-associated peptidase YedK
MCGRYTLSVPLSNLVDSFDVGPPEFDYPPRYNIAPSQDAPVIAQDGEGRRMGLLKWGLVPFWAKDPAIGNKMINARSETVNKKPAFRSAFQRRRCAIPADGFFEWKKGVGEDSSTKVPHWIHRVDGEPFAMAGLWEKWEVEDRDPLFTFTILTVPAVPALSDIHPRMPAILPRAELDIWLDPDANLEATLDLLGPNGEGLEARPVSTLVNSPRNDVPEILQPLEE